MLAKPWHPDQEKDYLRRDSMLNSVKIKIIILLLVCTLVILGTSTVLAATAVGPELSIPSNIPAQANSVVDIPISFKSGGKEITSMVFSIDYDETWLEFDPGLANAIVFTNIPNNYSKSCSFDALNTDGELDCNIIGFGDDIDPLSDSKFVTIKLRTKNAPDGTKADVLFGSDPAPSFGNAEGQSEPGSAVNGSVYFGEISWFAYLPILFKYTPVPTTETPTPVTPTPVTPTPETPTPTPETPTPPPSGCENLIVNGGFEKEGVAWLLPNTQYPARYTNAVAYAGEASMRTGINLADNVYSYSSAWQPVEIPDDATSVELTFFYKPQTTEPLALRLF